MDGLSRRTDAVLIAYLLSVGAYAVDVLAGWALALILVGLFRLSSAVTLLPATASRPSDGSL